VVRTTLSSRSLSCPPRPFPSGTGFARPLSKRKGVVPFMNSVPPLPHITHRFSPPVSQTGVCPPRFTSPGDRLFPKMHGQQRILAPQKQKMYVKSLDPLTLPVFLFYEASASCHHSPSVEWPPPTWVSAKCKPQKYPPLSPFLSPPSSIQTLLPVSGPLPLTRIFPGAQFKRPSPFSLSLSAPLGVSRNLLFFFVTPLFSGPPL